MVRNIHTVTIKTIAYVTRSVVLSEDEHKAWRFIDWDEEIDYDGIQATFHTDELFEVIDHNFSGYDDDEDDNSDCESSEEVESQES